MFCRSQSDDEQTSERALLNNLLKEIKKKNYYC